MHSPATALLWEIWRRNRMTIAVIVALTVAGRFLDAHEAERTSLVDLMWMASFALLFGVVGYTESPDSRGIGRFPARLFRLPVSTLQLVALPVLTGIVAIELLYLLWLTPISRGGMTSPAFVAVLLAAMTVLYQAVLWTMARLGALRIVIVGAVAVVMIGVALLPSFPPTPPPWWRSEPVLAGIVGAIAILCFLGAWRHVARLRCGGVRSRGRLQVRAAPASVRARQRSAFRSPAAAQFWFEWRCGGQVLPLLVLGILLIAIAPASWVMRNHAANSLQLLVSALAMPIVLAIPVGMAFAKPTFWSEDVSVPPFLAVRPLTDEEIVAIKVEVAAVSTMISWLLALGFAGVWLSLWGNLDALSQLAIQWWAFHEHSIVAVFATAALFVIAGMLLTWRFLVVRLWSGLSGSRTLFVASVLSVMVAGIAWMVFDGTRLPGWLLDDPERMGRLAWILAVAVISKYSFAAYSWRRVSPAFARRSLLVWAAGTACLLLLAVLLWGTMRIYVALDIYRFRAVVILAALLVMPLARVGLASSSLARNRHR